MKKRYLVSLWLIGVLVTVGACGTNYYEGLATKDGSRYHLEEVRLALDANDYEAARTHLDAIPYRNPQLTLLEVSVTLGESGLGFWTILLDVFDKMKDDSSSAGSGMEAVFSLISDSVFGNGADRTARLNALASGVNVIVANTEPGDTSLESFRCFLAGILVLPTVNDGTAAMTRATTALDDLNASLDETSGTCPDITNFETAMAEVGRVQKSLDFVMKQTDGCSMLNVSQTADNLNAVEKKLQKFTANADKGCTPTVCEGPLCQTLQSGCLASVMSDSAEAGDGKVSRCELIYHCRTPGSCF